MNSNTKIFIVAVLALLIGGGAGYTMANKGTIGGSDVVNNDKKLALYQDMRRLWADHVIWTRAYIIAALEDRPDASSIAGRLYRNQDDLGQTLIPYYGEEPATQLTTLLTAHIDNFVELIAAAKVNDQPKYDEFNAKLKQNSEEIATLLSSANSNWDKEDMLDLMNVHIETTANELKARVAKDYSGDVRGFDIVFDHIQDLSDALSAGIIEQFPDKF